MSTVFVGFPLQARMGSVREGTRREIQDARRIVEGRERTKDLRTTATEGGRRSNRRRFGQQKGLRLYLVRLCFFEISSRVELMF